MLEELEDKSLTHTPGPWRWQVSHDEWELIGGDDNRDVLWDITTSSTDPSTLEANRPDANLIAAAPDLLAALKALIRDEDGMSLGDIVPAGWSHAFSLQKKIQAAEEAIKKAHRGQA